MTTFCSFLPFTQAGSAQDFKWAHVDIGLLLVLMGPLLQVVTWNKYVSYPLLQDFCSDYLWQTWLLNGPVPSQTFVILFQEWPVRLSRHGSFRWYSGPCVSYFRSLPISTSFNSVTWRRQIWLFSWLRDRRQRQEQCMWRGGVIVVSQVFFLAIEENWCLSFLKNEVPAFSF